MHKLFAGVAAIFVFLTFLISSSFGQECRKDAKEWNPLSVGPVVTWTAPVCCTGDLMFQPFFFYDYIRGTFNEEGHYKHFKDSQKKSTFREVLFLQYGLFDRFDIGAQGAYQQVLRNADGKSVTATGFEETYLYFRYCLLDETKWLPTTTFVFQLTMPTGKYQKGKPGFVGADIMTPDTSAGAYEEVYGIIFTKRIKPFKFHADFQLGFPNPARVDGVNTKYGSYFNYNGAVEYFFHGPFNIMVEANGLIQGDRREDGYLTPSTAVSFLSLVAGLGWSDERIQMLISYQRTLAGTNVDVDNSVIATFTYTF
jgi:hypothetical protein